MKKRYTSPVVSAVGTIAVNTMTNVDKDFGVDDQFTFQGLNTCLSGHPGCENTSA